MSAAHNTGVALVGAYPNRKARCVCTCGWKSGTHGFDNTPVGFAPYVDEAEQHLADVAAKGAA